jgi:hypothetical protein
MPFHLQHEQTIIFRLWTGHCHLQTHLGLSHNPDCTCETGLHTPEHILQYCDIHREAWDRFWPSGATIGRKLWDSKHDLREIAHFINSILGKLFNLITFLFTPRKTCGTLLIFPQSFLCCLDTVFSVVLYFLLQQYCITFSCKSTAKCFCEILKQ